MSFVRGCYALFLVSLCFLCSLSIPVPALQALTPFAVSTETESESARKLSMLLSNVVLRVPWKFGMPTRTTERLPVNYLPLPPGGSEAWFKNGDGSSWAVVQIFPLEQLPGSGPLEIARELPRKTISTRDFFDPVARYIVPRFRPSELSLAHHLRNLAETNQVVSAKRTMEPKSITLYDKLSSDSTVTGDDSFARHYWVLSAWHISSKSGPTTLTVAGSVIGNGHYGLRFGWVTVLKFKYMEQMLKAISASSNSL